MAPLYVRASDLKSWRIAPPKLTPLTYKGKRYYALSAIPGIRYRTDAATQTLHLKVPASAFRGTVVDGFSATNATPSATPWGGFVNYDFLGSHVEGQNTVNGLFELGLFNGWGVGTSRFYDRDMATSGSHLIRLETAWRHDNPASMTSLVLGDSISQGGQTALAVRMGGIKYGTNFSTRPYFVTFPMPGLRGSAALPSTVDLYVNGLLKGSEQVPAGPFSVPTVPVETGPGKARLVVHNALGQAEVITTSFYASSSLLKPGLNEYSISAGKLRRNFGMDSNNYSGFATTGLARHGFTEHFTGELYGEVSNLVRDFSLGATFASVHTGAISTALAVSDSALGQGVMGRLGVSHQWRNFNIGADVRLSSPDFTELGYNGLPAPKRQVSLNAGAFIGKDAGSVYASYLDQSSPLYGHTRLVTLGYSVTLGDVGFLNLNAFRTLTGRRNTGASLTFTMSFGRRSSLTAGVRHQNDATRGYVQARRSLPQGSGYGYRVSTEIGPDPLTQAEFDYQTDFGTYRVGGAHVAEYTSYSAEASGGLAFIGGGVYPVRKIDGAFGLVEVPGLAGIPIYSENHRVATTDADGKALIPRLLPYQNNSLRIGLKNLPLGAQVNTLKIKAVPRYRSGVIAKFPVTHTHGATLTIRLEDGSYLPAGAEVRISGESKTFPVGRHGETYLTGLSTHNTLEVTWDHQSCTLHVDYPDTDDPIPDLGIFTCKGITP